ncbi:hypothetical protein HPB52_003900 [Rhipicephalus sanguineus]|uniref:ATP-dependent RNA helicase DHX36 n=1 Tax=Rhipicephalus sanguineus TaxID=34632 RepID=A0A9D4SVM3_RHISA|nr:hypothetical protein HPB52_003900 [Rhipicephalus sanguineus]
MSFHERRGGRHGRGSGRGSGSNRGGPGRGKRPSHIPEGLRGKEIGLYFARRGRARKAWAATHQKVAVSIDYQSQQELQHLIRCINLEEGPSHERLESINTVAVDYLSNASSSFDPKDDVVKLKIERDTALDERLRQGMQAKVQSREYQSMLDFRKQLPAYTMREEIIEVIERNRVVVISGETGSGKTTQVPQFILDSYIEKGLGSLCKIICTQPRRISAISVSSLLHSSCRAPRDRGSILFCTTGILLQQLQSDPYILAASHVILDEVHERDLQTDFLSIILKDLLAVRPDLRVILMSATINADLFSEYFGNCPRLEIPGIAFPVDVIYLEDILEHTGYRGNSLFDGTSAVRRKDRRKFEDSIEDVMPFIRSLEGKYSNKTLGTLSEWNEMRIDMDLVHALISEICAKKPEGAILVFLPGWEQINDLNKLLTADRNLKSSLIIPLHSMMPTVNQRQVFERPPAGVRKIVLATNIAETSITINDVVYVIDCGKIKMTNFDVDKNLATLNAEWVSRANAQQRKGRAGRYGTKLLVVHVEVSVS